MLQIEIGIAIEIDSLVGRHTTATLALTGADFDADSDFDEYERAVSAMPRLG
jgi:hypothetical protein